MVAYERRKRARLHRVQPVLEAVNPKETSDEKDRHGDCRTTPKSFLCPLTMGVMYDPVLDADGNTYERRALLEWLKENRTSPISRQPLNDRMTIPNIALREAIHSFMGEKWVTEKKAEVYQEPSVPTSTKKSSPDRVTKSPSPLRAKVDSYLGHAAQELCNTSLHLNEEGCCAFRYENITIVLDVPENVGIFCFYTRDLIAQDVEDSMRSKVYQRALECNFLQVETRGGCLAIRQHDDTGRKEVVFSYTDRVREVTSKDFTNILRSFIETTLKLRDRLTSP